VVEESYQCAEAGTMCFQCGSKQSCHSDFIEKVLTCLVISAFTEVSPENRDGWLHSLGIPEQNKEWKFKQIVFQYILFPMAC